MQTHHRNQNGLLDDLASRNPRLHLLFQPDFSRLIWYVSSVFFFFLHPIIILEVIPGASRTTQGPQDASAAWASLGFMQIEQPSTPAIQPQPRPLNSSHTCLPNTLHPKTNGTTRSSHPVSPTTTHPSSPAADQQPQSNSPTQSIILEEDPQRSVEIPENDEDDEATGDGLGEEDDEPDDEDELDDELDEGVDVDDKGMAGTAKPSHRRPLPNWLLEPFKARVSESSSQYRNAAGLPPLYAFHKTFWFPQPSSFFLITKGSTPQQIFNPLFFLWDPEALCSNGIPCPNCRKALNRHQVISRPRRCVGIDQTFWIIGYQYCCQNCIHPKSKKSTVTF